MRLRGAVVCTHAVTITALFACGSDGPGDREEESSRALAAADCPARACVRELFLGESLGSVRAVLADEERLFLVTGVTDELRIWRIDREQGGGELMAILPGELSVGPFDGESLYLAETGVNAGGVLRVRTDGVGEPELISADSTRSLAVDATHVYWLASDGREVPPAIKRRAKAGGDEEILVRANEGLSPFAEIAVLGGHLYWNDSVSLRRKPAGGGKSELFGSFEPQDIPPGDCTDCGEVMIAGEDGRLYWLDRRQGIVFRRTETDRFAAELVATETDYLSAGVFVLDGQLYWSTSDGVRRVPASGGEPVTLPTGRSVRAFAATPSGMYVADFGRLREYAPDGCPD